jgi:hypothetical protein
MSGFKIAEDALVQATQGYFSETASYSRSTTTIELKAVFFREWIEDSGVSTYSLTARIAADQFGALNKPEQSDSVHYNGKDYSISSAQQDAAGAWLLVLSE